MVLWVCLLPLIFFVGFESRTSFLGTEERVGVPIVPFDFGHIYSNNGRIYLFISHRVPSDPLVYWSPHEPRGHALPQDAIFLCAYVADKAEIPPMEPGFLIVYSLTDSEIIYQSRWEGVP